MDRLFLDANVLFSAAYRPDTGLLRFWNLERVVLCSSHYALQEAQINLEEEIQKERLAGLARGLEIFGGMSYMLPAGIILPDKDVPILSAAMEARATHLITGDVRHFGSYFGKTIAGILIQLPVDYLKRRPAS